MAKYCIKCGKPLPEGVEVCSECHMPGTEDAGAAAPFTRMTTETEVWKESDADKKKRLFKKKIYGNRQRIALCGAAVILVVVTVLIILLTSPDSRITRAIGSGKYERALTLYSEQYPDESVHSPRIDKAIVHAAEKTCTEYSKEKLTTQEAESAFDALYSFGGYTNELLADAYGRYTRLKTAQESISEADKSYLNGDYMTAAEWYKKVEEDDPHFEYAQERFDECLTLYAQSVLSTAEELIIRNDYMTAIQTLKAGNEKLYVYDTFSADIDAKLEECYSRYEEYILEEAKNLANIEEYDAAARMILSCTRDFGYETEKLLTALSNYEKLAESKAMDNAEKMANEFFEAGKYAEAFTELDTTQKSLTTPEDMDALISDFEDRFTEIKINEADEVFAEKRENLDAAVTVLKGALDIRETEGLQDLYDELHAYQPLNLTTAEYASKSGAVYRSTNDFEALGGNTYSGGWMWGENKSSVTYDLDGGYDSLSGVIAVRRDDNLSLYGGIEIWADDVKLFGSGNIYHYDDPVNISLDISGCEKLKVVFICSYSANSAENGYCYHGVCSLTATKAMSPAA